LALPSTCRSGMGRHRTTTVPWDGCWRRASSRRRPRRLSSYFCNIPIMSGSRLTMAVYYITRYIEPLIWALIAVVWVGLGPFAGIIALTVHSVASLGKLYSEAIESIDPGPIEAIQATGATRLQTIMYAVVPQMIAPFVSFSIYRWDINVRMSTVIGLVGGGHRGLVYRGHRGGAGLRELGDPSALRVEVPRPGDVDPMSSHVPLCAAAPANGLHQFRLQLHGPRAFGLARVRGYEKLGSNGHGGGNVDCVEGAHCPSLEATDGTLDDRGNHIDQVGILEVSEKAILDRLVSFLVQLLFPPEPVARRQYLGHAENAQGDVLGFPP
jgi:hypothetical protein